jgi:hypothetical protein
MILFVVMVQIFVIVQIKHMKFMYVKFPIIELLKNFLGKHPTVCKSFCRSLNFQTSRSGYIPKDAFSSSWYIFIHTNISHIYIYTCVYNLYTVPMQIKQMVLTSYYLLIQFYKNLSQLFPFYF